MKKLLKSDIYGSVNNAQIYYLQLKVNICSYCSWTVVTNLLKRMPKNKKGKTWLWDVYVDPNVLIIYNISAVWIELKMRLCFLLLFFYFFSRECWLFAWTVHCLQTHKNHFSTTFSLKMGLTILFTYLKIILLQCFQFSVLVK